VKNKRSQWSANSRSEMFSFRISTQNSYSLQDFTPRCYGPNAKFSANCT